eukprot:151388-Chlamydomonas_euryale.AAC.1
MWVSSWHVGVGLARGCQVGTWVPGWHVGARLACGCRVGGLELGEGGGGSSARSYAQHPALPSGGVAGGREKGGKACEAEK